MNPSFQPRAQLENAPPPPTTVGEFSAVYAQELSFVWRSLQRLGVQSRDLDDLTHEVFLTAFQRFDAYDASRPLRPWLFGIAFRVASAQRNRAFVTREVSVEQGFDTAADQPTPHDAAETAQTLDTVMKALSTLRVERKAVFVLHDIEGHSVPDAAEALAIPLNTAYTRLRAARAEFTEAYRRLATTAPRAPLEPATRRAAPRGP